MLRKNMCASNQGSVKLAPSFRVTNLTEWQPKLEDAMVSDVYLFFSFTHLMATSVAIRDDCQKSDDLKR